MKPYAESSEKNKAPILAVLREIFADRKRVLEIASGTGQHAVHFAAELPYLTWQPSELSQNLAGIQAWLDEAQLPNVLAPLAIDVNDERWPVSSVDAIFNANTVHIISWAEVERMFAHIAQVIEPGGCLCLYGPYNYDGKFTSESNARFDAWLKSRNPNSGVRDFEAVNRLAVSHGFVLLRDIDMPSNNRILVWHAQE
ncbi:MAG: class I SAM-dependent methyltransferase [Gallionella sp.]|nr:class I SAM-dependent methyltransferase [Gallionella sp.]